MGDLHPARPRYGPILLFYRPEKGVSYYVPLAGIICLSCLMIACHICDGSQTGESDPCFIMDARIRATSVMLPSL